MICFVWPCEVYTTHVEKKGKLLVFFKKCKDGFIQSYLKYGYFVPQIHYSSLQRKKTGPAKSVQ